MISSQNNLGYFPQMPVCDKHLSVELNSDFTLPDYQPEIRRLLSTRVSVMPPSEYIGNGSADLSGEVSYKILYLGADGKLYCSTLSDSYSLTVPFEFHSYCVNTDDITLMTSFNTESNNTRVLGPRKLNVRAKLSCHALALTPALYSPALVGAHNNASIENLILDAPCISAKKCVSEPQLLTDFISLDSQIDNVRIVDTHTSVMISECLPTNDKISIKGEVLMKILYCNDSESEQPLTMLRKLPLSLTQYCEGVTPTHECAAYGIVTDERFDISDSGIGIEVDITLCARAQKNELVPYINDAYSTERTCECKSISVPVMNSLRCSNGNLTQNETFKFDDVKLQKDAKIVDVIGKAVLNELSHENGRLHLRGQCDYQIIYYLDEEYSSIEVSSPLHYEFDTRSVPSANGNIKWSGNANVVHVRARGDGERLFVDSELNFCFFTQQEENIDALGEMVFGEKLSKPSGELLLCYPEKEARLWSVAKQYGESLRKIRVQNSIPEGEETVKKKFLII